MSKACKKQAITLLEVLLAVTLLTFVCGVIGINAYKSIQMTRFNADVERIKTKLNVGWELARLTQSPVNLKIECNYGTLFMELNCQTLPNEETIRNRIQEKVRLSEIEEINCPELSLSLNRINASPAISIPLFPFGLVWNEIIIGPHNGSLDPQVIKAANLAFPVEREPIAQNYQAQESKELYPKKI